ncbi:MULTISPECIES: hypothetical protein [unclassified Halomonas]|uniref:hypothetical protein n=1 Tax=unclassified Halomonas TaxID=2609666 RepID=UPI0040340CE3
MNNTRMIAAVTLSFLLPCPVFALSTVQHECSNRTSSDHYQQHYSAEEFVIFYDLSGDNTLADQTDFNNNDIPDIVEDTMLQLITMRDVLEALGFTHPFDQDRYERASVNQIYIGMRDLRANGVAFDPPHRDLTALNKPCVLLIGLSNELQTGNLTPAHELFHLYQYGYTVFKNSWYLEGMARWAEGLLGEREYQMDHIPDTQEEEAELFAKSYNAAPFWMTFIGIISPSTPGERNYSENLMARRYLDGSQVIHSQASTHGATAIINALASFDRLDRQISSNTRRRPKSWSNTDRSDSTNDALLLNALYSIMSDIKR